MPTNQFDDNQALWAAELNAISDALGSGGIVSGCSISKGSGDWDIDVTSGTIIEANTEASISSDTVPITDASGLSAGESRVTLIHADTGDTLASTDGSAAEDPASPDIPASEVLLGFVVVSEGDSTVADSDIFDIPALMQDDSVRYESSIFGDGSDGSITRSSNANENGVIQATDYTVESGVTMTVTSGFLTVLATDSIEVAGTIDANGQGGAGGSGGAAGDNNGGDGGNGTFAPTGTGGSGGVGRGVGGSGGDGDVAAGTLGTRFGVLMSDITRPSEILTYLYRNSNQNAGAGGGGGAGSNNTGSDTGGGDGTAPGGGGGGYRNGAENAGGDGGDGGGFVLLIAPSITVSGTIQAAGTDGASGGTDAGAGGGGSGGVVLLFHDSLTEDTPTYDVSKGTGAAASGSGGDGADGEAGVHEKVAL